MNDLEHDLKDLFATKATSIDVAPGAPADVLRRGRRREALTAIVGGLGAAAVIALVAAAMLTRGGGTDRVPIGVPDADRHAIIGGLEIDAPEGWTLQDLWPLAPLIGTTSESCSFEETGTPVGPGEGASVGSSDGPPPTQPSGDCVIETLTPPAGLPVLQLSNGDTGFLSTVCPLGTGDDPEHRASGREAHLYVGYFTSSMTPIAMSVDGIDGPCGPAVYDVRPTADGGAILIVQSFGSEVSDEDRSWVESAAQAIGTQADDGSFPVIPVVPRQGPGYVVATGRSGEDQYQIEIGLAPISLDGTADFRFATNLDVIGGELFSQPWDDDQSVSELAVGDDWILVGAVPAGTTNASWRLPDGDAIALHLVPTNDSFRRIPEVDLPDVIPAWGVVPGIEGTTLEGELVLG